MARVSYLLLFIVSLLFIPHVSVSADTQKKTVRIGFMANLTHAQALLAKASGAYEKDTNIKIEWVTFNAGPTAIEAIFAGAIDGAYIGPNPIINGHIKSQGKVFKIVSGSASGGSGLILKQGLGSDTDNDFIDKIIATPQLGNTQDVSARNWFISKGYTLKEKGGRLTLLPLANFDQLTMFQRGEIDGAWTVEPWLSRLEIEGGGKLYLDEGTLWPDGKYVTTELIFSNDFIQDNEAILKGILSAHIEITRSLSSDKYAQAATINRQLKVETGKSLADEVVIRAIKRVDFTWDPLIKPLFLAAEAAHKVGFIKQEPNLDGIYDLRILNSILTTKGLANIDG